ncbi:alanine--tRNA ligase, mitochondrial [Bacillus rossius redtenbacheri]|uniref:alanine--tRNA ligase, mitochondrial n=1 Tax=Bacillus rossius redtenbacheri TaxID=93214 RepID=UPI002FDEFE6C
MKHALIFRHHGMLRLKCVAAKSYRCLCTKTDSDRSCKAIRRRFIDFFAREHGHTFIRSSPVVPYCDATVAFVNAGMNQFKGVFLGQRAPPCPTVVNSQKCIRVGGKHSDLDLVGSDGYHHTFFEMLGNWSFNDYFKMEACQMAWELLTGPFCISPDRLYVTYFSGDNSMGLEPDLETKHIWRSIGVPEDRVLPFGTADNFWEMAATGPCGPCTEIHVDHVPSRKNAADKVNKGHADLTELWNLVFIQYNRTADGQLKRLESHHVDTGMGFERLIAVMQGKTSNYDTDVFQPLISAIQKATGATPYRGAFLGDGGDGNLDWSYRVLADHSRMVTVALADGMFPDQNHKLRRVLRKALLVSQQAFNVKKGLLKELTNHVAESLASAYPEIGSRLKQVQVIVDHEEDVLARIRREATAEWQTLVGAKPQLRSLDAVEMPGLVAGYRELRAAAPTLKALPADLAFKLYDTHGLDRDTIARLAAAEGLAFDAGEFRSALEDVRWRSRAGVAPREQPAHRAAAEELRKRGVPPTDDRHKYDFERAASSGEYRFPCVETVVRGIAVEGRLVLRVDAGATECSVVVDRTNFYHEAGGQSCDVGCMFMPDGSKLDVRSVTNVQGYVFHSGIFTGMPGACVSVGDAARLEVGAARRVGNMRNHTATHILNAALRQRLSVTCQKSSRVAESGLSLEFSVYGESFGPRDVEHIEGTARDVVRASVPVRRRTVDAGQLLALDDVTSVPGEVYPEEGIHLIEIKSSKLTSREPCCGTHVANTGDLSDLCVVGVGAEGAGVRSLRAVTGPEAALARLRGERAERSARDLSRRVANISPEEQTPEQIETLHKQLCDVQQLFTRNDDLPYIVCLRCLEVVQESLKQLKMVARTTFRDTMKEEMQAVLRSVQQQHGKFVVHFLRCSSAKDTVPLQKATRMAPLTPVLLFAESEGVLKARCCVPQHFLSDQFNAELWMQPVLAELKAHGSVPKGQNPLLVYNMKGKKVPKHQFEDIIAHLIQIARDFAEKKITYDSLDSGSVGK